MGIIQVSLHFYVVAIASINNIIIHLACITFHLHLKMSSPSLLAAHSECSLFMDGGFNFQLKVLHLFQTYWVAVELAEL